MENLHVNLMELKLRTGSCEGLARMKLKITGPLDEEGCVELTCVETVRTACAGLGQNTTLVLSDEKGV